MKPRDIYTSVARVNPVDEASIDRSELAQVERKVRDGMAREHAAAVYDERKKSARRRGRDLMIIAFAGLALGGSALAATGVWNPVGSDQPSRAPARSGAVTQAPAPADAGSPEKPGELGSGRRREAGGVHDQKGAETHSGAPSALGREPEAGQSFAPSALEPPEQPAAGGGASPQQPAAGGGVSPQNGGTAPGGQGGAPPPPEESPAPQRTTASVGCFQNGANTFLCSVRVVGEVSAPTGQVSFEVLESSGSAGQFSPGDCSLDEHIGLVSLCQVEYGPILPARLATAHYLGNAASVPSDSSPFEV